MKGIMEILPPEIRIGIVKYDLIETRHVEYNGSLE
jgi:hypothetical protein